MKKVLLALSYAVFLCLCATAVAQQEETPSGTLHITGSSTMCRMIEQIGKRFESLYPEIRINVECGGSERGIRDVRDGRADIGMVSRSLVGGERSLLGFPIARDGVSLIVQARNPIKSLSDAQVIGIFSGTIKNWKAVGGSDGAIDVVLRERQKSSTMLFYDYYRLHPQAVIGTVVKGDNPVTIKAVSTDARSIGYVSSGNAEHAAGAGIAIKRLPVNNVMPTARNIITGNYPISRPLMLVTATRPKGAAKLFIDFSLSSGVTDLIERYDYVPYQD